MAGSTQAQRAEYMFNQLRSCVDTSTGEFHYSLRGSIICLNAWIFANGFNRTSVFKCIGKIRQGHVRSRVLSSRECLSQGLGDPHQPRSMKAAAWLTIFGKLYGQPMPIKGIIRLPFRTKAQVYDAYKAEFERRGEVYVNIGTFYTVWRQRCRRIKRCRAKDNFGVCDTCSR